MTSHDEARQRQWKRQQGGAPVGVAADKDKRRATEPPWMEPRTEPSREATRASSPSLLRSIVRGERYDKGSTRGEEGRSKVSSGVEGGL